MAVEVQILCYCSGEDSHKVGLLLISAALVS